MVERRPIPVSNADVLNSEPGRRGRPPTPEPAPTTISKILRSPLGARYFGDGGPRWRQGRDDQASKTIEQAEHDADRLAKALRRDGSEEVFHIAAVLDGCSPGRPCTSGGCPICQTAGQRVVVDATRNAFWGHPRAWVVANVVCVRAAVDDGALDGRAFDELRRRLDLALRDCGVRAFGGFDISANRHELDEFAPFWSPHARIFASARLDEQSLKDRFGRWFPPDETTPRPVRIEPFDGRARGRAYALKPDFFERTSLERRWLADGSRSTYSTRLKPIWGPRRVELALALHQAGLDARLYLRGFALIARNGRAEIVRFPRTPSRLGRPGRREERDDRSRAWRMVRKASGGWPAVQHELDSDAFRIAKPASRPLLRRRLRRFDRNQGNAMNRGAKETRE